MIESHKLLAEYATTASEQAFRELISRYIDLVYSTAFRLVNGHSQLAEDVAQTVFVDLARRARSLPSNIMLGGWLHRHTCFIASKIMRSEWRRQLRERHAVEMNSLDNHSDANLAEIAPVLDDAINQLGHADRTAILLRFFERYDLRSVGLALGSSENAAQKRMARALEQLRALLKKRGVALSATALGSMLAADAVTAAPAGLAIAISPVALSAGASVSTLALLKIAVMTKTKIAVTGALMTAGIATCLVIQHQAHARLLDQKLALLGQAAEMTRVEAENLRLSSFQSATGESGPNNRSELLRLRQEVVTLRSQTNALAALSGNNRRLRDAADKTPLQLIEESKEQGILRLNFTRNWILAFSLFASENGDRFPTNFDQALPYAPESLKTETNLTTDQFEIVYHGSRSTPTNPSQVIVLREKKAWSHPTGQNWVRAYAFADGHSEVHRIHSVTNAADAAAADASWDSWERERMIPPSSSP